MVRLLNLDLIGNLKPTFFFLFFFLPLIVVASRCTVSRCWVQSSQEQGIALRKERGQRRKVKSQGRTCLRSNHVPMMRQDWEV